MSQDKLNSTTGQITLNPSNTASGYPGGVALGNNAAILPGYEAGRGGALAQAHYPTSGSATSIGSNFEIVHSGMAMVCVTTSGAVNSCVLQAGYFPGQQVVIANTSANLINFAAVGTSRVAGGVVAPILSNSAAEYRWNALDSKWYQLR